MASEKAVEVFRMLYQDQPLEFAIKVHQAFPESPGLLMAVFAHPDFDTGEMLLRGYGDVLEAGREAGLLTGRGVAAMLDYFLWKGDLAAAAALAGKFPMATEAMSALLDKLLLRTKIALDPEVFLWIADNLPLSQMQESALVEQLDAGLRTRIYRFSDVRVDPEKYPLLAGAMLSLNIPKRDAPEAALKETEGLLRQFAVLLESFDAKYGLAESQAQSEATDKMNAHVEERFWGTKGSVLVENYRRWFQQTEEAFMRAVRMGKLQEARSLQEKLGGMLDPWEAFRAAVLNDRAAVSIWLLPALGEATQQQISELLGDLQKQDNQAAVRWVKRQVDILNAKKAGR